jgi:hypothetical protein
MRIITRVSRLSNTRGGDAALARQHHALGAARRARREQDDGGVGAVRRIDALVHRARDLGVFEPLSPPLHDGVERAEPFVFVVLQPARLFVEHALQPLQPRPDRQHLVDLLLVLRHDEPRAGEFEHAGDLVGHGVGVERHGDGADHLRRRQRPVELGPVGAGDGDPVALDDAEIEQTLRERARLLVGLSPGPGAPDAVLFQPERRTAATHPGVDAHQLGERVVRIGRFRRPPHTRFPRRFVAAGGNIDSGRGV